jgi:hypothetical protein
LATKVGGAPGHVEGGNSAASAGRKEQSGTKHGMEAGCAMGDAAAGDEHKEKWPGRPRRLDDWRRWWLRRA